MLFCKLLNSINSVFTEAKLVHYSFINVFLVHIELFLFAVLIIIKTVIMQTGTKVRMYLKFTIHITSAVFT